MITVPRGAELGVLSVGARRRRLGVRRSARGVLHLRRDRALPDEVVERDARRAPSSPRRSFGVRNTSPAGRMASWASCAFATARPYVARLLGHVRRRRRARAACARAAVSRRLRERRRVGSHVRDVAGLVEALRDAHRRLRGEAKLAARLLLERRGAERRGRLPSVRLLVDRADRERRLSSRSARARRARPRRGARGSRRGARPVGAKSRPCATRVAVELRRVAPRTSRGRRCARRSQYSRGPKRHPLALPLDDETRRDRLDAARPRVRA